MVTRAAGLVVFRRVGQDIQYLLLQSSREPYHWTPPKGHVDPGENDLETALRETQEEAGLSQQDFKVLNDFRYECKYAVKGKPKSVIYFLAELLSNKNVVLSYEHLDFKWSDIETSCELGEYKETKNLLRECHRYLLK